MIFRNKICLLLLLLSLNLNAQDNSLSAEKEMEEIFNDTWSSSVLIDIETNNPGTGGDNSNNVTDAPIDGGLGFLLAAGAGYVANGLNRKRRRRKNNSVEETSTNNQ